MSVSNKNGDDNSGLHDLKALASSTKKRRTRRLTSEMDAQNSLLQSAAGLAAVALPDPSKEQPVSLAAVSLKDAPVVAESLAHETATPSFSTLDKPTSSSSKFLLVAGLGAVAAAAAAFYMLRGAAGGDGIEAAPAVAVAQASSEEPAEVVPAAEETAVAAVEPLALDQAIAKEAPGEAAVESPEAVVDESATAEPAEKKTPETLGKDSQRPGKTDRRRKALKSEKSEKTEKLVASKPEKAKAPKPAKEEKKSEGKSPTLGEGGTSLDDVLSSVTGGIDKPIVADKQDDKPSKKRLERGDVAKAMKAISPAAKGCYSAEEYTGTVIVKYSVAPDGSIKKVVATGAHKSSKTGKCVVSAVKKAKFPAFSGSIQSFSFPFLLSP